MLTAAPHLRRPVRNSGRGFTLIELVVAITLLGLLVALSLPSFSTWIRNSQLRTVADSLQAGLRTAQAEAVRRNRQVVIYFTDANPVDGSTAVAGGKNWALQTVAPFGGTAEFIAGSSLTDIASTAAVSNSEGATAVCFSSNGRLVANPSPGVTGASCAATPTTFTVKMAAAKSDDRELNVIVQIGGQLRLCDPKRPTLSATAPDGCPPTSTTPSQ